ncbi:MULTISPECIES: cassette chromosome recombinase CcrA [Staphylococcus]|uniref:Cassette chromosome recombinase A4 n=3 Tax=Staphylococcus haemolyticus TaxID=1283 RepID=E5RUN6_STAHA|nr:MULTISPECIES: recombinase family protein [Staphylococcus]AUV66212.1 recombinase family protein [Staphylococcus haemolyticus]AUV68597.1 recombinase family protein [Staphylococcus haemolyticus]MBD3928310.1 recombinase family protein [Staphylococcus haemolyticus]MBE7354456.1 recombinase family protein [Staphylococcus haemolyticus]MBE7363221.1 recombinase family protein [Staphylococcus haemolyticus]
MEEAIAYVRQSTLKQQSLATQKSLIMDTAKQYGWSNVTFYDDKKTGRHTKRSGYQRMVEAIRSGRCKVLCCYRLNRLHRNLKNAIQLFEICKTHHITIISVNDGYFNLAKEFDCFRLNILMSLAEMESNNISEQTRNGIREKAKQGKLITTHAPFGYRYRQSHFIVHEEEAHTVKAVYRWYLQGLGYKKISQHLDNNPNLIPRKPYQVRNILLNPNYCGRVINKYGTFNDIVPPIIDVDTFEEAQERRIHKQHNRSNSRNKLKRRIKCPYCQSTLTNLTIKKEKHSLRYYVCPKNMNEAYHTCPFKGINAQEFESKVLNTCKAYCDNQSFHDKLNETVLNVLKHQQMKHRQSHLTQEQLIEKLAQNQIDVATFKRLSADSESEEHSSNYSSSQIAQVIRHITKDKLTLETIVPLIDNIIITQTKQLQGIYFKNSPLNIVEQSYLITPERNEVI